MNGQLLAAGFPPLNPPEMQGLQSSLGNHPVLLPNPELMASGHVPPYPPLANFRGPGTIDEVER